MSLIGDITETDIQLALTPIQSIVFAVRLILQPTVIDEVRKAMEKECKLKSITRQEEGIPCKCLRLGFSNDFSNTRR